MRTLAAAFAALAFAGGAHDTTGSLIVFSADRAPAISGDVFRADRNGRVVNLTHSPWQDSQPLVSPNGKLVAFLSDRGGSGGLWVIGVDGTGLRHVPAIGFPSAFVVQTAWSPDSTTIALTAGTIKGVALTLVTLDGGRPRVLARADDLGSVAWSPDGKLVTVHTEGSIDAYTPSGRKAWSVTSGGGLIGWSAQGLLATGAYDGRVHVVDESGRQRFSVAAITASWSADGSKLTAFLARRTRVYSSSGRLISSGPASAGPLGLNTIRIGTTFAVRDGTHVYTHVIGCNDDGGPFAAIASEQRVPGTRSIVYASYCVEPFDNLYAMNGDGTGLRRLSNVQAQETAPHISPDRTQVAFEWAAATGLTCKGCATSIRTLHVDGSAGAALTAPPDCTFDASPSWSPDGTDIAYSHSSCSTAPNLRTMHRDLKVEASEVAWGPSLIAYLDGGTAPSSIWTVKPDGTNPTKVGWGNVLSPAWSADGRLAYLEGTKVVVGGTRIPLPFAKIRSLAWSPDGTRFLVAAEPKGAPTFDLYTVKTDGTDVQRLTLNLDVSSADWR